MQIVYKFKNHIKHNIYYHANMEIISFIDISHFKYKEYKLTFKYNLRHKATRMKKVLFLHSQILN